jgi:hypothetical protein
MGQVEVQGECVERVEKFLLASGCVRGVRKLLVEESKAAAGGGKRISKAEKKQIPDQGTGNAVPVLPVDARAASIAVKKMKPPDMKAVLRARGLSTQGTRAELQARLLQGLQ